MPYFEVHDEGKQRAHIDPHDIAPGIVPDDEWWDEDDVDSSHRRDLAGNYLDCDPEAYSESEAEDNDFEVNSFIDDASIHSAEGEEHGHPSDDEDDEIDYKALYEEQKVSYNRYAFLSPPTVSRRHSGRSVMKRTHKTCPVTTSQTLLILTLQVVRYVHR
jgi:hypothetical protein